MSGYMATINNLRSNVSSWEIAAVPITALLETDDDFNASSNINFIPSSTAAISAGSRPHVPKNKVSLSSSAYVALAANRASWAVDDKYENPGPIQYSALCSEVVPRLLQLESFDYLRDINELQRALDDIRDACRPGCEATVLRIATQNLLALKEIIRLVSNKK
jgi:hypothetical protein